MSADPTNPALESFHIDGSEFEAYAENLPPGALQGLLFTQEEFSTVHDEMLSAHAKYGAMAPENHPMIGLPTIPPWKRIVCTAKGMCSRDPT